jgi:hypothetical protein
MRLTYYMKNADEAIVILGSKGLDKLQLQAVFV